MDSGAEIKRRRIALDISQSKLAELAGPGPDGKPIKQQDVLRIEQGAHSRKTATVLAALDAAEGRPAPTLLRTKAFPARLPNRTGDVPIYASARGGPGEILFSFDPVDWVGRPDSLASVRDAFAVYIVGDSMEPAFEQGDLAFVNPNLPLRPGDDVLIFRAWEGEQAAVIKRLIKATTDDYLCKQFNPPRQLKYSRAEWPQCYAIVTKQYSRR